MFNSVIDPGRLRRVPQQRRSREKLEKVLDAADAVLEQEGADALSTTRVAHAAGIAVGSVYAYFPDKEAIAAAVALRHWHRFADALAAVAEAEERAPSGDPVAPSLDAMIAGFRGAPALRALWYGGLRTERVREATRPLREEVAASLRRVLAVHFPAAPDAAVARTARMMVLVGDGVLREAFRLDPQGDRLVLAEARTMLRAYADAALGSAA